MEDLEELIHQAQQAVNIMPQDHDLAAMLNNLGNMLEIQFERTGKNGGLERVNLSSTAGNEHHTSRSSRSSNVSEQSGQQASETI
jgi:hypothetical protein